MISLIIPIYNQADKLEACLKSIEQQSFRAYEVIIVNDGSNDGVEDIFANFIKENKITNNYLFINQLNQGAPAARNRGLKEAGGDYLFFCDADAILKPEALETLLKSLEAKVEAAYSYSSFYWGKKFFKVGPVDEQRLKKAPAIHTMALIRVADFPAQAWDESLKRFQDWDMWLAIYFERNKLGVFVDQALFSVSTGGTISAWLPSFAYKLLPFLPRVKKYQQGIKIIKNKYDLPA